MKKFRVLEIFGPTIQGEGRHIGLPCYFIRFGGCDYRCFWCDSPHAVLPNLVSKASQLTDMQIREKLEALPKGPNWVVFSGGNPAILQLDQLVQILHNRGYQIMAETQGSVFSPWLLDIDEICVSPKPPSSGNVTTHPIIELFLVPFRHASILHKTYLKIPIFDYQDYLYAKRVRREFSDIEMFLSVGNLDPYLPTVGNNAQGDPNFPVDKVELLHRMKWLMEMTAKDSEMETVRVLPQLHVLAWGNERGR